MANLKAKLIERTYQEDLIEGKFRKAMKKGRRQLIFKQRKQSEKHGKVRLFYPNYCQRDTRSINTCHAILPIWVCLDQYCSKQDIVGISKISKIAWGVFGNTTGSTWLWL